MHKGRCMRARILLSATLAVLVPVIAWADGLRTPSAKEQMLREIVESAAYDAKKDMERTLQVDAPEQTMPEEVVPAPRKAKGDKTAELISELSRDVDLLQSRLVVQRASLLATEKPKNAITMKAKTIYPYVEGGVFEVHAAKEFVTDIQLEDGEELLNAPIAGDTVRWKTAVVQSGKRAERKTHIMLRPLDDHLETNIILTTTKRTYHLNASSGAWHMPVVAWTYPQDEEEQRFAQAREDDEEDLLAGVTPEKLNFEYAVSGEDYGWKPIRVFDDGAKTYLQMPLAMRVNEAPALFVFVDGDPKLVNYRVARGYFIVDRLFEDAELRVGRDRRVTVRSRERSQRSFLDRLFD